MVPNMYLDFFEGSMPYKKWLMRENISGSRMNSKVEQRKGRG